MSRSESESKRLIYRLSYVVTTIQPQKEKYGKEAGLMNKSLTLHTPLYCNTRQNHKQKVESAPLNTSALHNQIQVSLPLLRKVAQSWQYWCVRSRTGWGRLVACTILRTLTAPSSSINLRTRYRSSGENWDDCQRCEQVLNDAGKPYLGVPAILPCDQTDQCTQHSPGVIPLLVQLQKPTHRLGREPSCQAVLVRLDALVEVVQSLSEFAQNFPFGGGLLVFHCLLAELGHLGPPDCVDAEILVEDHKQVVQPPLTETLVLELGI